MLPLQTYSPMTAPLLVSRLQFTQPIFAPHAYWLPLSTLVAAQHDGDGRLRVQSVSVSKQSGENRILIRTSFLERQWSALDIVGWRSEKFAIRVGVLFACHEDRKSVV